MSKIVTVHLWKEADDRYRSSIQEDTPADYAFPEPFWTEYMKKKAVPPGHLAPFGEAIFRSVFNSLKREEVVREILSGLKQKSLTFSIKSSEEIIHEVPWEIMKPPDQGFLGRMGNISFARTLPGHRPEGRASLPPYRILVILSLPVETYEKAPLDPLRELENLYDALDRFIQQGLIKIDVCVRASVPEIRARMVKRRYDVIHFIGHGGPGGLLILEDEADFNRSHETTREDITTLFGDLGSQAVILNACHTQTGTFFHPSLAMYIYKTGIPVVIANQASVEDQDAIQAVRSAYERLFGGQSISPVLDMARLKLSEWWKPVLFAQADLEGEDLFRPPAGAPVTPEGEKIFQDLQTFQTARVYVYRYRPLREITQHLAEDRKVIVLHGIGGAGKSFMADYLARFLRSEFAHVVALDMRDLKVATVEGIRDRILSIIKDHELIDGEPAEKIGTSKAFSLFWKRLNQAMGSLPWLLILDNFEIFQDEWGVVTEPEVREMLRVLSGPDWGGRLIITSRLIPYLDTRRSLEPVVEIGTYDEAEKRFFIGQLTKKEQKQLKEQDAFIENALGWHPLATDLLLKNSSAEPESVVDQRPLKEVLDFYRPYVDGYPLTFSRLFALNHPMSRELLGLIVKDADLIDLLVRRLRLISPWDSLMRLHPIFRFVFGQVCPLSENDRLDLTGDLASFEPQGLPEDLNRIEVLEGVLSSPGLAAEQKKELKQKLAEAASRIGVFLKERGGIDLSISYHKKALALRKELFGESHPHVAASYNNLGSVYQAKDDLDQAISYFKKALALLKELFGESHPDVAASYNNLGLVYQAKGDLDQAISYHEKALSLVKELLGERHPDVATSYNNLGLVYHDKGEPDQAVSYLNKALSLRKELFGERHPDVATSYNNLGSVYRAKSDLDQAISYLNKALSLRKELLGERHPDVATSYNNLGSVYQAKGDLDRAISYLNKALSLVKELFGERHRNVATSYNNLGSVYRAKGDLDQAVSYVNKALSLRKELFGERAPGVAASYSNLGSVYQAKRDPDQAISYHKKALSLRKELFGERHPDVAASYNNLGSVYRAKGDLDQAISYHKKALSLWKEVSGERHWNVATSYNNLGLVYEAKGELDQAISYHEKALSLWKEVSGERHPHVATSYNNLGSVYEAKGELDQAISYYENAQDLWRELGSKRDELRLCVWLSDLYAKTGREAEAAKSLCSGVNLLEFLQSDLDNVFWVSHAFQLVELAEKLTTELEEQEFYNCRNIIRQYQEKLGPVLESLRMMARSSAEKDSLPEEIEL